MHADVLIVTVTKVEAKTVLEVFQEATQQKSKPMPVDDRTYHDLGMINGTSIFMVQSEMGSGDWGLHNKLFKKALMIFHPRP